MTKHERSSRPDRLSLGRSADPMLDALLDGGPLPDGEDPARWQPVAQVLTALASAPESSEMAGEARALAEFRSRPRGAPRSSGARRRNKGWAAALRIPGPAMAAATGAIAMGGLLAVAYAGDLPAAAQRLAHDTIGAPASARDGGSGPATSPRPASPLGSTAGQASTPSGYGPGEGDRWIGRGHPSISPYRRWPARSAPGGGPSGRPGQYSPGQDSPGQGTPGQGTPGQGTPGQGTPGESPTPGPTQQPPPGASSSPSAGATPSPSAAPSSSQQSRYQRQPAPAATQSFPP